MSKIIILAGFPRSGTTWFANLINMHENVLYRHELIGRHYANLNTTVFDKIKVGTPLDEFEKGEVKLWIHKAHINTDRPPFFKKQFGLQKFPRFHHYAWLVTNAINPISSLYESLFTTQSPDACYFIKETRSLFQFDRFFNGLGADLLLFLVRRPHGSIASHLNGINKGTMAASTREKQHVWRETIKEEFPQLCETLKKTDMMSEVDFLSYQWLAYHQRMIKLHAKYNANIYSYEGLQNATPAQTKALFNSVGLSVPQSNEDKSLQQNNPSLLKRDSSDPYYSVYRGDDFDPESWKSSLTRDQIDRITQITSPVWSKIEELFICVA